MGSDVDEATTEGAAPAEAPLSMSWTPGRVAAVVAILAMVGFWAWVFSGAPAKQNPDYLQDRAYAEALEAFGRNLLDPSKRAGAARSGLRQAHTLVEQVRAVWDA